MNCLVYCKKVRQISRRYRELCAFFDVAKTEKSLVEKARLESILGEMLHWRMIQATQIGILESRARGPRKRELLDASHPSVISDDGSTIAWLYQDNTLSFENIEENVGFSSAHLLNNLLEKNPLYRGKFEPETLCLSPGGGKILTVVQTKNTGRILALLPKSRRDEIQMLGTAPPKGTAFAFDPDGIHLGFIDDNKYNLINTISGEKTTTSLSEDFSDVEELKIIRGGEALLVRSSFESYFVDLKSGKVNECGISNGQVYSDKRNLLINCIHGFVMSVSLGTGKVEPWGIKACGAVDISPDGEYLAIAFDFLSERNLEICEARPGLKVVKKLQFSPAPIQTVKFVDNKTILAISTGGRVFRLKSR